MPPRLPTRALSGLTLGNGAVASSSTLPPPVHSSAQKSARPRSRSLQSTSRPSHTTLQAISQPVLKRSFHASSRSSSPSAKDPYDVLGVKKDAKTAEIKKAYYQLAKKWHPDSSKEKGASERFHEIQAAYDILSDDTKRKAYDTYGSASTQEGFDPNMFGRGGAGGFGGFQDFGSAFGGRAGNAGDLFESLFGGAFGGGGPGGPRARPPSRGDDLEASVVLSFLESCNGVKRKINIVPVVDCKPCSGSGLKAGQKKSTCPTCKGSGQQSFQISGMFMSSTCQTCGGAGETIPRGAQCGECEGVGRVKERKEIEVDIPAGIEDGMKVKLPAMGDRPLSGSGPAGDLYVRVNVRSSPVFRRQGTNLYHDAKVPLHTALLGGKVRVPTLEGDVDVRVREGTQNGEEAVLKGRGVRSVYGMGRERGDLVVGWRIQIPRSLSPFQKKILQAYADDVEGRPPNVNFGPPPVDPHIDSSSASGPSPTPFDSSSEGAKETDGDKSDSAQAKHTPAHKSKKASRKDKDRDTQQQQKQEVKQESEVEEEPEEEKKRATG